MAQQTEPVAGTFIQAGEYERLNAGLQKRPRLAETLIQGFLFFCGALSIFTTIGIVYVLASQSLLLFSGSHWLSANKRILQDVYPNTTQIKVTESGHTLAAGDTIRVQDEIMKVESIDGQILTVLRGQSGTKAAVHDSGAGIDLNTSVSVIDFFTSTEWAPQLGKFGIWPLLTSTLLTSFIAMLVALPLGLAAAIYLSEYASLRARSILKPVLELLAGIPTVVYGYFALTLMTPLLRAIIGKEIVQIYNTASAGIVIGILILPLVASMSEDALSAVPRSLREAAYGLGATKLETAMRVVVPAALSGITAAFIVAISRAVGETMIVAIAAGAGPNFTLNPFQPAETMTGHIVRISGGDLSYDSLDYDSIFAIGLLLFLITLVLNIISQRVVAGFRVVYE